MVPQEDAMLEANPCFAYLPSELEQLYAILKSDGLKLVFASLAAARAVVYYCGKSRYYEARELASAAIMASILLVFVAVSESRAPTLVRQILACEGPSTGSPIATAEKAPAGPRLALGRRPGERP